LNLYSTFKKKLKTHNTIKKTIYIQKNIGKIKKKSEINDINLNINLNYLNKNIYKKRY
jgi:hypothetical protein